MLSTKHRTTLNLGTFWRQMCTDAIDTLEVTCSFIVLLSVDSMDGEETEVG